MLGLNLKELKLFNKEYGDDIVSKYTAEFEKMLDNLVFEPLFDKEEDERRIRNSIRKLALKEGESKGIEQGELNKQLEIAKNLLSNKISIDIISKSTGLSIDEIKELK